MMRTILVPLAQGLAGEPALQAALAVAKRMNSHIRAMFVRPEPETHNRSCPRRSVTKAERGRQDRQSTRPLPGRPPPRAPRQRRPQQVDDDRSRRQHEQPKRRGFTGREDVHCQTDEDKEFDRPRAGA
jgi:hypothetical protein